MVSLSLFIGQIIADIANARTNADYAAACVSEQYHADPFLKNLPIPHYIIDEAEIEVPVMVVGVSKQSDEFEKDKKSIFEIINSKLPIMLVRSYKFNFTKERTTAQEQQDSKILAEEQMVSETILVGKPIKANSIINNRFNETILKNISQSAQTVTKKMLEYVCEYLENYNYEIIKLLDLTEKFIKQLSKEIKADMHNYSKDSLPYFAEESILKSAKYMGDIMFHYFKTIMKSDAGVNIDVKTVQMNEYATNDCLMHIKIKIKEQDLNLVVEEDTHGKEKRYLSLT